MGATAKIKVENGMDKNIVVQLDEASIDGNMVDYTCSVDVSAKKTANDDITILEQSLKDNKIDIDKAKNLEVSFKVLDAKTFNTIEKSKVIKLKIN